MAMFIRSNRIQFMSHATIEYYNHISGAYWQRTKDWDLRQQYEWFLSALPKKEGARLLDFGCGPGRDTLYFRDRGFDVVGLDGGDSFCQIAREQSFCLILKQDFLTLDLEDVKFDGIFANASLFHVPRQELTRVLGELYKALDEGGILFSSNPEGNGEDWDGESYGNYMGLEDWRIHLEGAGFQVENSFRHEVGEPWRAQDYLTLIARRISPG